MCGITGFFNYTNIDSSSALQRMISALHHRGPNDNGMSLLESQQVALGHTRLSIIDTSSHGHQPMISASKRYTIVYNGEIYNFKSLKKGLVHRGFMQWHGESDTEVLLALIEHYGFEKALKLINGMFAIACWDSKQKTLLLARDRMGEKPLYYGTIGNQFVFASELKAIHAFNQESLTLSSSAIQQFLQFCYVPAPLSIYQNIYKLEPGHFLEIPYNQLHKTFEPKLYWHFPKQQDCLTVDEAEARLSDVLYQVISEQMISDRPLGAFLSGGIDSSLVVALMQQHASQPVKTFSIGFNNPAYNEAPFAKQIANHLKTEHHELILSSQQALDIVDRMPSVYDEPFADSSQLPTYLVSGFAKQHVTVVLSGDGADECFGGYTRYIWTQQIWHKVGWLPSTMRRLIASFLMRIPIKVLANIVMCLPKKLRVSHPHVKLGKLCELLKLNGQFALYKKLVSTFYGSHRMMVSPTSMTSSRFDALYDSTQPFVQTMMDLDAQTYLPDDIMVKVDRASMAHSLETRAPFLDKRVVELAWQLPLTAKIDKGNTKIILKRLLNQYVPRPLFERPKMGFGIPVNDWLRCELKPWLDELFNNSHSLIYDFVDKNQVIQNYEQFQSKQSYAGHQIWALSMLLAWQQNQSIIDFSKNESVKACV